MSITAKNRESVSTRVRFGVWLATMFVGLLMLAGVVHANQVSPIVNSAAVEISASCSDYDASENETLVLAEHCCGCVTAPFTPVQTELSYFSSAAVPMGAFARMSGRSFCYEPPPPKH